ncbi:MAG: transglutaminase-like domain-containing protein [Lachnospiraceae bacterium]
MRSRQRKWHVSYFLLKSAKCTWITGYLNEIVTYTEEIDPKNTDASGEDQKTDAKTGNFVTDFLMTEKKGYSVHYASAAVLMYRCFGIPARYVEGYLVTPEMARKMLRMTERSVRTGKRGPAHGWKSIRTASDGSRWK